MYDRHSRVPLPSLFRPAAPREISTATTTLTPAELGLTEQEHTILKQLLAIAQVETDDEERLAQSQTLINELISNTRHNRLNLPAFGDLVTLYAKLKSHSLSSFFKMTHSLIFYPALYSFWEEQLIQQHEDIPAPLINSVPLRRHRFVGVSKPTPVERHPFVVLAGAHCHEEQANIEEALRALAQARKATSSSNLVRACECLREAYIKPPYLSSLYELYNQCT